MSWLHKAFIAACSADPNGLARGAVTIGGMLLSENDEQPETPQNIAGLKPPSGFA